MERELFKKGDKVVMHTCIEAEKYNGKIWTCRTDEFTRGEGVYEESLVFLEGFSGSFAAEYLQKLNITDDKELEILNLKENNRLLENGSKQLCNEIKLLVKDKDLIISSHIKYVDLVNELLSNIKYDDKYKKLVEKIKDSSDEFDNKFIYS